jgi:hypothetical protein
VPVLAQCRFRFCLAFEAGQILHGIGTKRPLGGEECSEAMDEAEALIAEFMLDTNPYQVIG